MLLITLRYWKMHLQSRPLWWKRTICLLFISDFFKFFHLTKLFKILEFFKFNCFNLRKGNTNLHAHGFTFSKKKKNLPTLSCVHFDETDMLFSKIINSTTLCSNLEIRQTREQIIGSIWVIFAVNLLNGNWNFLYFMGIKLHIAHDITLVAEEIENLNHLYSLNIAT